jgi:hypothetical protein
MNDGCCHRLPRSIPCVRAPGNGARDDVVNFRVMRGVVQLSSHEKVWPSLVFGFVLKPAVPDAYAVTSAPALLRCPPDRSDEKRR